MKVPNAAHERGPIARRFFDAHRRVMNDRVRNGRVAQASVSSNLSVGTSPLGSRHDRRLRVFRLILFAHLSSIDLRGLERFAIAYAGRLAGSVPRAVASVTQREARPLPLAVLSVHAFDNRSKSKHARLIKYRSRLLRG